MAGSPQPSDANDANISTAPAPSPSLIGRISHCASIVAVTIGITAFTAIFFALIVSGNITFAIPVTVGLAAAWEYVQLGATTHPLHTMFFDYLRATFTGSAVLGAGFGAFIGLLAAAGVALGNDRLRNLATGGGKSGTNPMSLVSPQAIQTVQLFIGLAALPIGVAVVKLWRGEKSVEHLISGGLLQSALYAAAGNTIFLLGSQLFFRKKAAGGTADTAPVVAADNKQT